MAVTHVFAGLRVSDYGASCAWYERLLGRPADRASNEIEAAWQLVDAGWLYIVADLPEWGDNVACSVVMLLVDDLDAILDDLQARQIEPESVAAAGDGGRTATFVDPDGNRIAFADAAG